MSSFKAVCVFCFFYIIFTIVRKIVAFIFVSSNIVEALHFREDAFVLYSRLDAGKNALHNE